MLHIEVVPDYGYPCHAEKFTINGISADKNDFGVGKDTNKGAAEPCCCDNNEFVPYPCRPEILEKYNITESEYKEVVTKLSETFYVGFCCWCE